MQQVFALLAVGAFFVLVWLLQPILTPFLVGIGIAYLGDPLVDRLEAMRVNRTLGVFIVFFAFSAILAAAILVLVPMLVREVSSLVNRIPDFIHWLQQTASPLIVQYFGVDPFDIKLDVLRERLTQNWQQAGGIATRLVSEVTASGMALVAWVMNLALIPVVAFYLMRDWDLIMQSIRELVPRDTEKTVVTLVAECDEVLSAFLRGQLLIMFLLGCIYALGLVIVGLDLAILIGMLAGLASIVPYLGFAVGIVAAVTAAVFQYHDLVHLVYVAIVFGIGQLLEGTVLTPLLVGDRIGLHPVAVIFAVLAGGQLFGFVGVLLALPVAAVIMVFVRHAHARYIGSQYYGNRD
ncbi:MAG: AI-2E family transporter [Pseudomonadales bacterium]|nr:AI-2E family transporter [Pseudomonadales bacterium]